MSENSKTQKGSLIVILISLLFLIYMGLCLFLAFSSKIYELIVSAVACLLVTITMNIADRFNVNKYNFKIVTTISIICDIIAVVLLFVYNIFSISLSIPAFILSRKAANLRNNKTALLLSVISITLVFISLGRFVIALL